MRLLVEIVFYVFGILYPITILLSSIKSKKRSEKLNKYVLVCIIFIMFYIFKIGGYMLIHRYENGHYDNKILENKDKNTENVKDEDKDNENNNVENKNNEIDNVENTETKEEVKTTKKVVNNTDDTTKSNNTNNTKIINTGNHEITQVDGVYYVDGYMIVNKTYALPSDYKPKNPHMQINNSKYGSSYIDEDVYKNFEIMKADALALGLNIWIQSGYRSYSFQEELYNHYVNKDGKAMADTYSARAGHSEHQTGLAFDLNSISDAFQYTEEGKWVNNNAYKYGFILRYPKGKDNITGYKYESWHLRYVGYDLAEKLYNNGDWITMEEYFNLTSTYE